MNILIKKNYKEKPNTIEVFGFERKSDYVLIGRFDGVV